MKLEEYDRVFYNSCSLHQNGFYVNNISEEDYNSLKKLYDGVYKIAGMLKHEIPKETILYYEDNKDETPKLYRFFGCYISILERDRVTFSYDELTEIDYEETSPNFLKLKAHIRKQKIDSILG